MDSLRTYELTPSRTGHHPTWLDAGRWRRLHNSGNASGDRGLPHSMQNFLGSIVGPPGQSGLLRAGSAVMWSPMLRSVYGVDDGFQGRLRRLLEHLLDRAGHKVMMKW